MCACVRVYQSATDIVGCTEIFGGQRGLTQSGAPQRRKLWCVHTYVDPDWTLTIQLTAALEAWQREANRYLEQTGGNLMNSSSTHETRLQFDFKQHKSDGDTLEMQQVGL